MEGLVSTIIPVFNRPQLLREAVASVLAQTYRPIELIVVDDGSTDSTPQVIADLGRAHPEIRAARRENGGPGLARETGRQLARGEFIQYLDSDDLLLPRKLELQVAALRAHPECGIAYCYPRHRDPSGREIQLAWKNPFQVQERLFPSLLESRWWETGVPLYRRAVTDAVGPWTGLRNNEDIEYDFRVAAMNPRLCLVGEVLVEIRDHSGGRLGRDSEPIESLRDRARARMLMVSHARQAGIDRNSPEMRLFARDTFLLSRQCGAAGLVEESRELFALASHAGAGHHKSWQFRAYRALANTVGWKTAGRAAALLDRLR